ncbi:MAG: 5'/3'-nucleotidase SurE [Vampirovibrionales bacterium]
MATLLLSNDDGIHAKGLQTLMRVLGTEHDVYVVAPHQERSASGHHLTLHTPILVEPMDLNPKPRSAVALQASSVQETESMPWRVCEAYSVAGSPCDCVKLGLNELFKTIAFDYVITGINAGPNLGTDVIYSGTVSAASEGTFRGIPSIALSHTTGHLPDTDFTDAALFFKQYLQTLEGFPLPKDTLLNINIPGVPLEKMQGVRITTLADRLYRDTYDHRKNHRGTSYFWLVGEVIKDHVVPGTDVEAMFQQQVSVTPLQFKQLEDTYLRHKLTEWHKPVF